MEIKAEELKPGHRIWWPRPDKIEHVLLGSGVKPAVRLVSHVKLDPTSVLIATHDGSFKDGAVMLLEKGSFVLLADDN